MSASKLDTSLTFGPFLVQSGGQRLTLPARAVRVNKNGIEFRSPTSFAPWTEMSLELDAKFAARCLEKQPDDSKPIDPQVLMDQLAAKAFEAIRSVQPESKE